MRFLALAYILLFLTNCSENNIKTSHIVSINLSEDINANLPNLKMESLVPLEKNDLSLFGNIMTIEYYNDRIYLLDVFSSKSIMVFSKKGDYINRTELGKGPDQILNPFAFCIDKNNQNILVYDQMLMSIITYDLDLNYQNRTKYDGIPFIDFAKLDNEDFLIRSHFHHDYEFTLYSKNFNSVKKRFIEDHKHPAAQSLLRSTSSRQGETLFISSFDYNIYKLMGNEFYSEYYIDFGKYGIEKKDIGGNNKIKDLVGSITSGQNVSSLNEIDQSKNFILFHVYFKDQALYYIYSTKTDKIYRLNDYFNKGILPKCAIRGVVENDTFFAMVEPLDMFEFQENTGKKLVDEEIDLQQNPFILTFSISEN